MAGTDRSSVIQQIKSPWCPLVYNSSASIGFGAVERPGTGIGKKPTKLQRQFVLRSFYALWLDS